jgi:hypothetical protein
MAVRVDLITSSSTIGSVGQSLRGVTTLWDKAYTMAQE